MKTIKQYPLMSLTELKAQFKNSWVLIVNPDYGGTNVLQSGYFIYKNKNQDKVFEKLAEINQNQTLQKEWNQPVQSVKVFYTGEVKLPKNHIFCL